MTVLPHYCLSLGCCSSASCSKHIRQQCCGLCLTTHSPNIRTPKLCLPFSHTTLQMPPPVASCRFCPPSFSDISQVPILTRKRHLWKAEFMQKKTDEKRKKKKKKESYQRHDTGRRAQCCTQCLEDCQRACASARRKATLLLLNTEGASFAAGACTHSRRQPAGTGGVGAAARPVGLASERREPPFLPRAAEHCPAWEAPLRLECIVGRLASGESPW